MTPTDLVQQSISRVIVRRQVFKVRSLDGIVMVLDRLLSERHTGIVTITTSQGGVLELTAEDKAKLPD